MVSRADSIECWWLDRIRDKGWSSRFLYPLRIEFSESLSSGAQEHDSSIGFSTVWRYSIGTRGPHDRRWFVATWVAAHAISLHTINAQCILYSSGDLRCESYRTSGRVRAAQQIDRILRACLGAKRRCWIVITARPWFTTGSSPWVRVVNWIPTILDSSPFLTRFIEFDSVTRGNDRWWFPRAFAAGITRYADRNRIMIWSWYRSWFQSILIIGLINLDLLWLCHPDTHSAIYGTRVFLVVSRPGSLS